mgnify:FL=1
MEPSFDLGEVLRITSGVTALLIPIVIGLVEYCKKLGSDGPVNLILSMAFGILFGAGYQLAAFGVPDSGARWFILILAALIPGLAASGVYDFAKGSQT